MFRECNARRFLASAERRVDGNPQSDFFGGRQRLRPRNYGTAAAEVNIYLPAIPATIIALAGLVGKATWTHCFPLRRINSSKLADPANKGFDRVSLSHSIYPSISEVPRHEWDLLTREDADLTMDRRLIGAYEATMAEQCRSFTIVIRDVEPKAVALACACLFRVDVGHFPWLDQLVARAGKAWRNRLKIGSCSAGCQFRRGRITCAFRPARIERPF